MESALWIAIGAGFLLFFAAGRVSSRSGAFVAAMVFVAFGISDIVEARTGAWWRPCRLLLWKGACIGTMVVLGTEYYRGRRARH